MNDYIEKISLEVNIVGILPTDNYVKAQILIYKEKVLMHIFLSFNDELLLKINQYKNRDEWSEKILCKNAVLDDKKIKLKLTNSHIVNYGGVIEETINYIWFQFDYIQYSYKCKIHDNSAKFRLNQEGIKMIQDYYSLCRNNKTEDTIILPKRADIRAHKILESTCFPKFIIECVDKKECKDILLEKIPVLEWENISSVESVIEYNSWICLLASLFYHIDINYEKGVIYLNGIKTIVRNYTKSQPFLSNNILTYFIGLQRIYNFIDNISFVAFNSQKDILKSIIYRYLQSSLLNGATKYIVLYNIMEQCQQKSELETFDNLDEIHKAYKQAMDSVKVFVADNELQDFKNRWNSVWNFLKQKPYKNSLKDFLKDNNINVNMLNNCIIKEFNSEINDYVRLRNKIAHGSNIKVADEINNILSFIDLILILNKLDCPIKISNILKFADIYINTN